MTCEQAVSTYVARRYVYYLYSQLIYSSCGYMYVLGVSMRCEEIYTYCTQGDICIQRSRSAQFSCEKMYVCSASRCVDLATMCIGRVKEL